MHNYRFISTLALIGAALSLIACSDSNNAVDKPAETAKTEATKVAEDIAPVSPAPVNEAAKAVEVDPLLKRGKIVWFKCRSCHEVSANGPNKVGPNLHGLIGAKAGAKEGFVYSDVMKNSEIIWDDETLDAFLKKPTDFIKGTKMAFVGIEKESDRKAVIAYLNENTKTAE